MNSNAQSPVSIRQASLGATLTKPCSKCKEPKDLDAFTIDTKNKKYGRSSWCRKCQKDYRSKNFDRDKKVTKNWELQSKYGISLKEFNKMVELQDGLCGICNDPQRSRKTLHVDHCHKSGIVRGLLCGPCNRALGLLAENSDHVAGMLTYIWTHQ